MSSNLFGKEKEEGFFHFIRITGMTFESCSNSVWIQLSAILRYGYRRFVILELNTFSNGVNRQFCDNQIVK